jgi:hypothetical protein
MRHVSAGAALRSGARLRDLHDGLALPRVRAVLCVGKLRSVQDEHRLRRYDRQLLAGKPNVPRGVHEQPAVRPRRQRADLQCPHRSLRGLQCVRRLPHVGERLRPDDAAMRAMQQSRRLRRNLDAGLPAESLRSMCDQCRLSGGHAVLRFGRRLSGAVRSMPAERPLLARCPEL